MVTRFYLLASIPIQSSIPINRLLSHITMSNPSIPSIQVHNIKSRQSYKFYPARYPVPDNKVQWSVQWDQYQPAEFTDSKSASHSTDPDDPQQIRDIETRLTYENDGKLIIDPHTNRPLNPLVCDTVIIYRYHIIDLTVQLLISCVHIYVCGVGQNRSNWSW